MNGQRHLWPCPFLALSLTGTPAHRTEEQHAHEFRGRRPPPRRERGPTDMGSGDSLNAVPEAIRREKGIECSPGTRRKPRCRRGGGGNAGELAVCPGSCGPGNMHLINGLYDAHCSQVPVLAIASHIPSDEIGSQYFQETRPTELFRDCTVFCKWSSAPTRRPHQRRAWTARQVWTRR